MPMMAMLSMMVEADGYKSGLSSCQRSPGGSRKCLLLPARPLPGVVGFRRDFRLAALGQERCQGADCRALEKRRDRKFGG